MNLGLSMKEQIDGSEYFLNARLVATGRSGNNPMVMATRSQLITRSAIGSHCKQNQVEHPL